MGILVDKLCSSLVSLYFIFWNVKYSIYKFLFDNDSYFLFSSLFYKSWNCSCRLGIHFANFYSFFNFKLRFQLQLPEGATNEELELAKKKGYDPHNTSKAVWCPSCQNFKPRRATHCRDCNCCILKMDHHCNSFLFFFLSQFFLLYRSM